jgi:hypothetical protein
VACFDLTSGLFGQCPGFVLAVEHVGHDGLVVGSLVVSFPPDPADGAQIVHHEIDVIIVTSGDDRRGPVGRITNSRTNRLLKPGRGDSFRAGKELFEAAGFVLWRNSYEQREAKTDPRERTDWGPFNQTDKPWKGNPEKEQRNSDEKIDLEKW